MQRSNPHPLPRVARVRYLIFFFLLFAIIVFSSLFQPANPFGQNPVRIIVPKGATSYSVARMLEEEELVKVNSSFTFMLKVLGWTRSIQAGEYEIIPADSLLSILLKFKNGRVVEPKQIAVTFPEGSSIYNMGEILREQRIGIGEQFKGLVERGIKADLRNRHWGIFKYIPSESLEGYLYPDTYYLGQEVGLEPLVELMLRRFEDVVIPFWEGAQKDTKYNLHEILTLASIIEKEAQKPEERAIISSVYHNRLKIRMHLGADPTIKYALERPTKKVYINQLNVDSPYNTYKRYGLPPGPICNPGIESIRA
ncbi:MAG: endolytic transglycosylase MltG, partial [bacterium]